MKRNNYIESKRKWYLKNKSKVNAYMRAYKQTPKVKEKNRIRKYACEYLQAELGNKCQICGSLEKLEIHHKKYTNNKEDVILLCNKCHSKIHKEEKKKK